MRLPLIAMTLLALSAGPLGTARAEPIASGGENAGYQDGFKAMLDAEAREALGEANLDRAWELFAWLVRLDPRDARALRELGRVAAAKGEYDQAERILARCIALRQGAPDPEVHFIRGEALLALGRRDEALQELDRAEAQLDSVESTRQSKLWRARIYTLRGDAEMAVPLLEPMLPKDPASPEFKEITLLLAEAHILAGQSDKAEKLLRRFLRFETDKRAQDMLAWALAKRDENDRELMVRELVSRRWDGIAAPGLVEYARALERAHRPDDALVRYREAEARGNLELRDEIDRLEGLLSPELMVRGEVGEYPTGNVGGVIAGAMVPAGAWVRLSALTSHHRLAGVGDKNTSSASSFATLRFPTGDEISAGGTAWQDAEDRYRAGASAIGLTSPGRWLNLYARADYNQPWLESAAALRESGSYSALQLQLYTRLFTDDLVLVTSGRSRRLRLAERGADAAVAATEHFGTVGLDWIAYADHGRAARGASLQPEMLLPADFATSLVFSYRHNEVITSGDLMPRVFLVDRSRSDQLTLRARRVVDREGILALGVNGGFGYDWLREARLWQVGGELLLSLTPMTRLTVSSMLASETTAGITGERFTGAVGINADL